MCNPRESAPDIPIPIFLVTTVYPGVAPEDIEKLITIPIEKKLKELSNVDELSSSSSEGASVINIEFTPDVDLDQAFQRVRDKVDLAKPDLPDDAEDPILTEVNVSEFPIAVITLTGGASLAKLEDILRRVEDARAPIEGAEIYEIVRTRLFQKVDEKTAAEVASAYAQFYRSDPWRDLLPQASRDAGYEELSYGLLGD